MEKNIPTVEVEIGDKKVSLYQWLTQEEEDKYNAIMLGDIQFDAQQLKKAEKGEMDMKVSMAKIADSNKFLIQSICTTPWEEVNSWKPTLRAELLTKIQELRSKN